MPANWKSCIRPVICKFFIRFIFKLHLNLFLQDKRILVVEVLLHLELITVLLPDLLKDVSGHDAHEGEPEEPGDEEKEVGADERDAGLPETAAILGEKVLGSKTLEKSDIPKLTVSDLYTCQIY